MKPIVRLLRGLSLVAAMLVTGDAFAAGETSRPNIILIMADDMGYSDLGCFGGEIETPHIDRLAARGLRFTQFYNAGRCCPTRASLLTGLYAHQAGMGAMTTDEGPANPGYRGRLSRQCVTLGEVLQTAGYRTFVTGKWHVGEKEAWWPLARGFDAFYGCPEGGGFYFRPSASNNQRHVVQDNRVLYSPQHDPPIGWYSTDAWTDEGLKHLRAAVDQDQPFFWYLAHNAPHYPLQARPEEIAKYRGRYLVGWDRIREQRFQRLRELGILDSNWQLPEGDSGVPDWESLSQQEKEMQDLRMATYAAMIDCVDQGVGRIQATLDELGIAQNTLILFLQDNGGSAEGGPTGSNSGSGVCGTAESYVRYGKCWAEVSNTPFRKYKKWVHEGGTATPLVVHWPRGIAPARRGALVDTPAHVIDVMATLCDVSGAEYPATYQGQAILPPEGQSLLPIFEARDIQRDAPFFFEHMGNRAIREERWKLVAEKGGDWELYDIETDRTEIHDLAAAMPEKVNEMAAEYEAWCQRCFVHRAKTSKPK